VVKGAKLLEKMKANPLDWQISDVATLCAAFSVECTAPRGGSHYKIKHTGVVEILTIPSRRPIKPVYIRDLVRFIESVQGASS
jgi:hypothetical protein